MSLRIGSVAARGSVVLLRHGQTQWALEGRHTGRTDVPLTDLGVDQAKSVGGLLDSLELREPMVISSPRKRALDTADLADLTISRTWDALREWDYGDYEGLTTPQIRAQVPGWTVWSHPCPGGETFDQVRARGERVLALVLDELPERDVILVGHGHFSRVLLAMWAELPISAGIRFALRPAALARLGFEHGSRQIVSLNVTA